MNKESDFGDVDYALVFDADVVVVVDVAADDYFVDGGLVGWSGSCCLYW